jgi:hypothetical protein
MKRVTSAVVAALAACVLSHAQLLIERGPDQNIVQWSQIEEIDGETVEVPHRYVELGSGLNYWSPEQSAWIPSVEAIEFLNTGAVFRQGQYRLLFASNINDINGNLEWFPSDDQRIAIQTVGLAITEEESGDSIWIAQLKDAQGFLTAPNEVTWPSCFDNIDASVRVRVQKHGFENDVILHERPVNIPFQGTCRLEVWHNIISGPEPTSRSSLIERSPNKVDGDCWLQWGNMQIGPGTAFLLGDGQEPLSFAPDDRIPVAKVYFVDPETKMRFLIESVPLEAATESLRALPPARHALNLNEKNKQRMIAARKENAIRHKPLALETKVTRSDKKIAAITPKTIPPRNGFLLDFATLTTTSNQIFAGNVTYYIASNSVVNLTGKTVIEPGAVVKFGQYSNNAPVINILGSLDVQTRPYAPAVFTSCEDRTVGETNTALTASINTNVTYGAYHLVIQPNNTNPISLHDVRTLYANNSFSISSTNQFDAWNIQASRISGNLFECGSLTNNLRNVLAHGVGNVVASRSNNVVIKGEHFTVHTASKSFFDGGKTGCSFSLINPLLIGVTNSSSAGFSTLSGYTNASDLGIFKTVGSGAHYLADNSPYRNIGTTGISTNLSLGIFKYSTTYPPAMFTNNIVTDTVLSPQAARDTDTPDLGYHYPALDWAASGVLVTNSVALTLTNGVAVATFGATAFTLNTSSRFDSEGKPLSLNRLVRYNTVQEQPEEWGGPTSSAKMLTWSTQPTQVSLRLTEFAYLAYTSNSSRIYLLDGGKRYPSNLIMRDCEIYSAYLNLKVDDTPIGTAGLTNNVFHRSLLYMEVASGSQSSIYARNNLFRYSNLQFVLSGTGTWSFQNNLFDSCTNTVSAGPANSYNGYFATTALPSGSNNQTVSVPDYQTGVQGQWYYPNSGTNLFILVNAGSTSVTNTGLFHYTVRTDHTKDTATVDIGYHYVAIDSNGPIDTDQDGLPDYLEDRNGDGSSSGDATDWQAYNSFNGLLGTPGLELFTPLQ